MEKAGDDDGTRSAGHISYSILTIRMSWIFTKADISIVERIMLYAGEDFTLENFYAKAVMHSEQLLSAFQKTEFLPKVLI